MMHAALKAAYRAADVLDDEDTAKLAGKLLAQVGVDDGTFSKFWGELKREDQEALKEQCEDAALEEDLEDNLE